MVLYATKNSGINIVIEISMKTHELFMFNSQNSLYNPSYL